MREEWKSAAIEAYRSRYARDWANFFDAPPRESAVTLLGPSFYILDAGGRRVAIDPCFRFPWIRELAADRLLRDFTGVDTVLITHAHSDHLDIPLLGSLRELPLRFIIPDFISREKILAAGIRPEQITWIAAGQRLAMGGLTVTAFDSPHMNPAGTTGVPEYGYCMETPGRRLLFPVDVRNYDAARLPDCGPADCLFMHVWLGRGNALNFPCEPYLSQFCDFTLAARPRRVFLTHLYEIGRPLDEMWTYTHAGLVMDALLARDLDVELVIPRIGVVYDL